MSSYPLMVYAAYGVASLVLTMWIARTLFKNGAVFLEEVFADNPRLAGAVNHLLVVGFYLLNLGYACLLLREGWAYEQMGAQQAVEVLASKLGALLVSLGVMHMLNLYVLHRIRRRARLAQLPPPLPAQFELRQTT